MSKKTEGKASSNDSNADSAASVKNSMPDRTAELHSTNGHTTAHSLDEKAAMLTQKKRGGALLQDDEREELMMANRGDASGSDLADSEKEFTGSLSGKDTWNFILLVVLCMF